MLTRSCRAALLSVWGRSRLARARGGGALRRDSDCWPYRKACLNPYRSHARAKAKSSRCVPRHILQVA